MRVPCSVPILTLNAKHHLARLLPVLQAQFDDVFIVDGNSTDGTRAFAQEQGIRIEQQFDSTEPNLRITDFTEARLRSWSLARHDWIFLVDADELPTPALLERVRSLIAAGHTEAAHRFHRTVCLPSGREVTHAFFYPEHTMIRLFHRKSGTTLDPHRQVHERFVVPAHVRIVVQPEAFQHTWPEPHQFREKLHHYAALEYPEPPQGLHGLFRWVLWYNVRSGAGQLVRAVQAWARARVTGGHALPWAYTRPFLRYRLNVMIHGVQKWIRAK